MSVGWGVGVGRVGLDIGWVWHLGLGRVGWDLGRVQLKACMVRLGGPWELRADTLNTGYNPPI